MAGRAAATDTQDPTREEEDYWIAVRETINLERYSPRIEWVFSTSTDPQLSLSAVVVLFFLCLLSLVVQRC